MSPDERHLQAIEDEKAGTISIYWENGSEPILVQNAWQKVRPYIHPVLAPDGNGVLTEYRPGHHTHQTGLYWGLKEVNGRDYFMECCKPDESGYYQKISSSILVKSGLWLKWQTVYDLLDENGSTILTETQTWVMKEQDGMYVIDLHWRGDANTDITVGEFFVGGLFLRMPWYPGITAEVVNAVGQRNGEAEAQRSMWVDVGMQVDGRDDMAHIAIFDHPVNPAFPVPWRVDNELGVGPSRQILGDWKLDEGQTEEFRYRLIVYTGDFDSTELTRLWTEYIIEECPDYF
ncbi:MAG: PmoA family protein [Balneolaceae bacterium]|nr:PmoA family protein [Balneolaceae bacterium]